MISAPPSKLTRGVLNANLRGDAAMGLHNILILKYILYLHSAIMSEAT